MTSKSKQAFLLPDEFAAIVDDCRGTLGLVVVVEKARGQRDLYDGTRETLLASDRIFLAEEATTGTSAPSDQASPARCGWVLVEVPRIEDTRLYGIQVGARGDWFDKEAGIVRDNKEALKRFNRVCKIFARRLRSPVQARNVVTGAEASYSSLYYSVGAADWWARGGQLRQTGSANLDFTIPDVQRA